MISDHRMLVSVVVLNWHGEEATARCVQSVHAQRLAPGIDVEVIVVDNETSTGSRLHLDAISGCQVVASQRNLGFAGGMNLGAAHGRGEVLALLNNDLVLGPDWLQTALSEILSDERIGIVGGKAFSWDATNPLYDTSNDVRTVALVDGERGFATLLSIDSGRADVASLDGSNLVVRRDLWRHLGGFDEDYFAYCEDVDLCARASALGYRLVYCPEMQVWHTRNVSSQRVKWRRAFWAQRNQLYNVAKHFPERTWRRTVVRVSFECLWYAAWGRRTGIRGRASTPTLPVTERVGAAISGAWGLSHLHRMQAKRRWTASLGQHDEGWQERLRRSEGPCCAAS